MDYDLPPAHPDIDAIRAIPGFKFLGNYPIVRLDTERSSGEFIHRLCRRYGADNVTLGPALNRDGSPSNGSEAVYLREGARPTHWWWRCLYWIGDAMISMGSEN
ncbi:MAG TPA: hypothetical protein VLE72_02805 [Candidatus Saccharimonadales bacterium]|nr:hypothetical protein [Candidatus Saccharimonadales bacterium]